MPLDRLRCSGWLLAGLWLLSAGVALAGPEPVLPDDPAPLRGAGEVVSASDVAERLLRSSPELARIRLALRERASEVRGVEGAWDPILGAELGLTRGRAPVAQGITRGIASSERYELSTSVTRRFRPGTSVRLSLTNAVSRSAVPIQLEGFSDTIRQGPDLEVGLTLGATQPILQGAGRAVSDVPAVLAALREDTELLGFGREASSRLTEALVALVELDFALRAYEVRLSALQRTRRQLEIGEAQVASGRMAAVELDMTRQRIAAGLESALAARGATLQRSDALRRVLGEAPGGPVVLPAEEAGPAPTLPTALEAACAQARAASPEVAVLASAVAQAEAALVAAEDPLRPRLDATASLTQSGLDDGYGGAWAQFARFEARTFFAGLLFSLPLGNRAAREEHLRATLGVERARLEVDEAGRRLCHEIAELMRQHENLYEREGLAALRVALATRAVEAEQERFARGLGTVQLGLEAMDALEEAELSLLRVHADQRIIALQLAHLLGVTLSETLGGTEAARAASGDAP